MFIPINIVKEEIEIDKSKFICVIYPINTVEEVKTKLNNIKEEYPKARHYLYAYKVNNNTKSNDDNEPGSISKGFIELINHHNLTNTLIIVIRYFGGIKLGASRLLRTYLKVASEAMNKLSIGENKEMFSYTLKVDYANFNKIKNLGYNLENISYSDIIKLDVISPTNILNELKQFSKDIIVNKVSRLIK